MARRRSGGFFFFDGFEPSTPRQARGGIKAQSKRGSFAKSWWAKRWIAVLEGFQLGGRLGRGRNYARRGQVLSVDVARGVVSASVQGSRSRPYKVSIRIKTLSKKVWKDLAEVLARQAVFAAKLLAGEMPENIEEAFAEAGASLFPTRGSDLKTSCSCPDWSNPCKHIAAVYYLLGEEFDRDPFLLFRLRGMEKEKLVSLVGPPAADDAPLSPSGDPRGRTLPVEAAAPEPLPADPELFWGPSTRDCEEAGDECQLPGVAAALPKRLGSFPFWRGQEDFLPSLEDVYQKASAAGLHIFLGEDP